MVNLLVQLGVLSFQVSQFTGEQLHFSSQLQFLFISCLLTPDCLLYLEPCLPVFIKERLNLTLESSLLILA